MPNSSIILIINSLKYIDILDQEPDSLPIGDDKINLRSVYKMIDEKFVEVLTSSPDSGFAIVTQGPNEPHVVNSWNSYVHIAEDGTLLVPAGRMAETEKNLEKDNRIQLTITNREVMGKSYKGTGFLVKGTGEFLKEGPGYDIIKSKFPWARAALAVKVDSLEQTL